MSYQSKNNVASSKSLLPEYVTEYLNKGTSEGFRDGWLNLESNNINDSMIPELCEWIIKLGDKVKILSLGENQITSVGASMLFDTLKTNNASIKEVNLGGNKQIDDECMKSLGEYINSNKSIEIIWLDETSISDAGIEILSEYFIGNTTLKELHLSGNKGITDKSIPLLIKMIESSCIEDMGILGTSITQKNIIHVLSACNAIKCGSTSLHLYEKLLNDDDLIKICDAMKKYGIDNLKELFLWDNKIALKGASVLFDTLTECNSVITMLVLSNNRLDDNCMKQLGEYIEDNQYLENFYANDNNITDKGIEMLCDYLIGNIKLKTINFRGSKGITDASVPYLVDAIKHSHLAGIDILWTSISDEKEKEIYDAFKIPVEQREIPIRSSTKSAAKISTGNES